MYCTPSDVRLIIHTALDEDDLSRLIVEADTELDELATGLTLSADEKRQCSRLLVAITISNRMPKSYTIGSARIDQGDRVKKWKAKLAEVLRRNTGLIISSYVDADDVDVVG